MSSLSSPVALTLDSITNAMNVTDYSSRTWMQGYLGGLDQQYKKIGKVANTYFGGDGYSMDPNYWTNQLFNQGSTTDTSSLFGQTGASSTGTSTSGGSISSLLAQVQAQLNPAAALTEEQLANMSEEELAALQASGTNGLTSEGAQRAQSMNEQIDAMIASQNGAGQETLATLIDADQQFSSWLTSLSDMSAMTGGLNGDSWMKLDSIYEKALTQLYLPALSGTNGALAGASMDPFSSLNAQNLLA